MYFPDKGEPVTPCMDVYKENIQSYGSSEKSKLRILVRGDLHKKEIIGYTWSPKSSTRTIKYFLSDDSNHKSIVHQLNFIGAFLQANVKHRVFVNLERRYG